VEKWAQAANQGLIAAQCELGVLYSNGQGAPESDKEAVEWFRKAANQGYAQA